VLGRRIVLFESGRRRSEPARWLCCRLGLRWRARRCSEAADV